MNKTKALLLATLAVAGALASGAAAARSDVYWSIGIQAPLDPYGASIGTTISNARPVMVRPAPVYYAPPAPVYYAAPPVVYVPQPVAVPSYGYVRPAPVYVVPGRHHGKHWKHHKRWRDRYYDD